MNLDLMPYKYRAGNQSQIVYISDLTFGFSMIYLLLIYILLRGLFYVFASTDADFSYKLF